VERESKRERENEKENEREFMRVREWVWVDRGRQRDRVISCASCAGSRLNFQQRKGFLLSNMGLNSAKRQLTFK